MDGLTHPVGDQPPEVYWKRRLAVIVAVVVLALLLWWLISAMTGGSGTPATTPGASNSANPTSTSSTSPATVADPSRPCTDADVTVVAGPQNAAFKGDKRPTFKITVTSKGPSACMVDPTTNSKIVIKSGDEKWFDSSTCKDYATFDAEKFLLQPGDVKDLSTTWNRGRDDKGCSADLQTAHPGYYWITATVQGLAADKLQFQLS